jgi:replicative DNA helicase
MASPAPTNPLFEVNPPASIESEKALLGAIFINPEAYFTASAILVAEDFFFLRHGHIWRSFTRLHKSQIPIDIELVAEDLENHKHLEAIGGRAYLAELTNSVPTSMHAEFYAQMVHRSASRRRMLSAADEIKRLAADETIDVETSQARAFNAVMSAMQPKQSRLKSFADLVQEQADAIEFALDNPRQMLGDAGCLIDVANLLRGYQAGKLIISAGRPGMGKSVYLLSDALALARRYPILIFSLEMPADEIMGRVLQNEAGLNIEPLMIGRDGIAGYERYMRSVSGISGLPIFIDDTPNLTPAAMEAKIQMVRGMTDLQLGGVFVDYLQLINARAEIPKNANREQEISYISRTMKGWAKTYGIFVHAASQLSRALESRADKRPLLSDLRESGSLEQDADIVQLLYRDSYYNRLNGWIADRIAELEVNVAKHRGGPTGLVNAAFDLQRQRIVGIQRRTDVEPRPRHPD